MTKLYSSLYIHIPFCRSKCPYCAFVSSVADEADIDSYVSLLEQEFILRGITFPEDGAKTVYIGGGTPALLSVSSLDRLFRFLSNNVIGPGTEEVSLEAIPSSINAEKCAALVEGGVTRVTVGVQSFDTDVLRPLGREQELSCFTHAVNCLRSAGIENIGADLILGLPGESLKGFSDGLEQLLRHNIMHLSAYFLRCEEGTPFADWLDSGKLSYLPDWKLRAFYSLMRRRLLRFGFLQYEVSNFALPGYEARHNCMTWQYETYAGLGVAAVGFDGNRRRTNPNNLKEYRQAILGGGIVDWPCENIGVVDRVNEKIMLALRTTHGLDLSKFYKDEGVDLLSEKGELLRSLFDKGWLVVDGGFLRCTPKGMLWLDTILVDLFN